MSADESVAATRIWCAERAADYADRLAFRGPRFTATAADPDVVGSHMVTLTIPALCADVTVLRARVAALEAEREGLRAYAARYAFLRDNDLGLRAVDARAQAEFDRPRGLDWYVDTAMEHAAIDAARDAGRARGET